MTPVVTLRKNHVVRPLPNGFGAFDNGRNVVPDREMVSGRSRQKGRNKLINDFGGSDGRCIAMKRKHEFPALVFSRPTTFPKPNYTVRPD